MNDQLTTTLNNDNYYGRPMEYGRPLYFCPVVSSSIYLLSYILYVLFSSLTVSRRRLNVCHTSTVWKYGVALVGI